MSDDLVQRADALADALEGRIDKGGFIELRLGRPRIRREELICLFQSLMNEKRPEVLAELEELESDIDDLEADLADVEDTGDEGDTDADGQGHAS